MSAENTPPRLNLRGLQTYLNAVEGPRTDNRKLIAVVVILSMAIFAASALLVSLFPLKERVPYVVEVETTTGKVAVADQYAKQFRPEEKHIRYHLVDWALNLAAIDEHSRGIRLPKTFSYLRGEEAIEQWRRYVSETHRHMQRLAEKPTYRRQAELVAMDFLTEDTALIRVEMVDNAGMARKRVQFTVKFVIIPPTSEEDVFKNPLGLWILSFGEQNEMV